MFNDSLMKRAPSLGAVVCLAFGDALTEDRALPQGRSVNCLDSRPSHQLLRDEAFQELAVIR